MLSRTSAQHRRYHIFNGGEIMAISVKKGFLWRTDIENKPGTFAKTLEPFAKAGVNLQIVMGYTAAGKSAVEIFPITDEKGKQAAKDAGLKEAHEIPCLILEGADKAGLAHEVAKTIADAGINLHFAICQSVDGKFQACFGFGNDQDAEKASALIKAR
jgi:hypothetical protein